MDTRSRDTQLVNTDIWFLDIPWGEPNRGLISFVQLHIFADWFLYFSDSLGKAGKQPEPPPKNQTINLTITDMCFVIYNSKKNIKKENKENTDSCFAQQRKYVQHRIKKKLFYNSEIESLGH